MLLKLISLPSQPTIHFSLTLPTFPSYLDPPQSYTAQINHLLVEDLEVPNTLHSLDKSVGLMSLLEEVVFEIKDATGDGGVDEKSIRVTCRFVDGAVEEWVLGGLSTEGIALLSALDSIIHNVQESTLEDEKEHERYLQSRVQKNRSRGRNRLSTPPGPSQLVFTSATKPRHKKQRSLFMQIVSSIVNLTSSASSSSSSHLPTFVDPSNPEFFCSPPPPTTSLPTPPSSKRARFLRRIARSNLVNAYRRHVLPELTRRFPKEGGFGVWILHSMRRRALERMEDLIEEAARLHQHQHQHQHQQVLELRQRHEHEERKQEQQFRHQQIRARSPIRVDERPFGPRFSMEEAGFSATTMTVPLSFSDEGGSAENENEPINVSGDANPHNEEVEDDLETITDGSSVHTPSSTSHIGSGFTGGGRSDSPSDSPTSSPLFTSTTATSRLTSLPPKSPPSNPQTPLPPHFHFEYTQLSRLRQRLHSLILFADSQTRIAEDEKRNREEIILVRGRRRAWLNGELGVGKGVWGLTAGGSATGAGNGMGHMQWGFAAPFKSSPLARYSWSASTELDDESMASTNARLLDTQHPQVDEEDEDDFPYDEFRGPPAVRSHTLSCAYGRQSRQSRYTNGGGSGKRLLPVAEEIEYEYDQNSTSNSDVNGDVIDVQLYKPPDLSGLDNDDSFHHRDDSFLHYHHQQEDGDVDSLSDGFSLEDPRELDLELGFGLQDPNNPSVGEDGQELFSVGRDGDANHQEHDQGEQERQRRSGESIRIAFEMERPKIIPRVRDGLADGDDEYSMLSVSTSSSSSSTRSSGLLSWGYWGVGKSSSGGGGGEGGGTIRRRRSWKNGIGIGIAGLGSRGRSLNKTCHRRGEEEEEDQDKRQQQFPRFGCRVSTSSTSSTTSTSSTKSQHQREPAQVESEHELHRDQGQDEYHLPSTPLLCQPVSFSVSHAPALAAITTPPPTASTSTTPLVSTTSAPTTFATLASNDTTTSPKDTTENSKEAAPTITAANSNNISFVPTPLSFTTKKLCMTSPAPNVYADIDVSVVHVGDDDKSLNLAFGANQGIINAGASHNATTKAQGGIGHTTPRLRPRRHKREYQYQHQHHHHHAYGNDVHIGQDECDEYELAGYGHFEGGGSDITTHLQHPKTQRHNSMIHARHHLNELLLEEGLLSCDPVGEQEEFTLAMDVPARGGFGLGHGGGKNKALRKMQYLQLHQNRDSSRNRLHSVQSLPLSSSTNSSSSDRLVIREFGENPKGSVVC